MFYEGHAAFICSMEYIYFARPDSNIAGINVHTARKNMGRNLAKESPVKADMVVGVPNFLCQPQAVMRKLVESLMKSD